MLAHLDLEAELELPLRQRRQQPVRADQNHTLGLSLLHQLRAISSPATSAGACGSTVVSTCSIMRLPFRPDPAWGQACQTRPLTPLIGQSHD